MKKILSFITLFIVSMSLYSQNSYTISSGSYYYYPSSFTVNVGDTVHWVNDGGLHNVNFDINSITGSSFNNPESFISSPTTGTNIYTHVFTIAGNYDYDCSVGSHAANGMVGSIIVNGVSSTIFTSLKEKVLFKVYDMFGREVNRNSSGLLLYIYQDGTLEKKHIITK